MSDNEHQIAEDFGPNGDATTAGFYGERMYADEAQAMLRVIARERMLRQVATDNADAESTDQWAAVAEAISITNQESYDRAVELLLADKALQTAAETHHRPMIKAGHDAHQAALDGLKRVVAPLQRAERTIKLKIGTWDAEQRRLQAEQERKIKEAEAQRAAEEAERIIEEAEAAGAPPEEVKELIREVETRPIIVPRSAPTYTPAKGVSSAPVLKGRVDSFALLVDYVAKNRQYLSILAVDDSALQKLVKALGRNFSMPGVTLVEEMSVRAPRGGKK